MNSESKHSYVSDSSDWETIWEVYKRHVIREKFSNYYFLKVDFISFYLNNKEPNKKKNRDRTIAREARNVISGTNIEPSFAVQTINRYKPTYNLVVLLGVGNILIAGGFGLLEWTEKRIQFIRNTSSDNFLPFYQPAEKWETETFHSITTTVFKQTVDNKIATERTLSKRAAITHSVNGNQNENTTDHDFFNAQRISTWNKEQNRKLKAQLFWEDVLRYGQKNNFDVAIFGNLLAMRGRNHFFGNSKKVNKSSKQLKSLVPELFTNRGASEDFCETVSLYSKTGQWQAIYKLLRQRTVIYGLGKYQVIPALHNVNLASSRLRRDFIRLYRPQPTFSGFRVSLVNSLKIACFMKFGHTNIAELHVDIWGDGVRIGKQDTTRFAYRILNDPQISSQSVQSVFTFAMFRGPDSRYNIERNIGWDKYIGDQTTAWLFQQTKGLSDMGVRVTYTGDQPFLLRLFLGISCDKDRPSKMPLWIDEKRRNNGDTHNVTTEKFLLPKTVDADGKRMGVEVKFREDLGPAALAFATSSTAICPDILHGIIRCVESDMRKWVNKIINVKRKEVYFTPAIIQLEKNITIRGVKRPFFQFNVTGKGDNKLCNSVSFSGIDVRSILASLKVLENTEVRTCLFNGVWSDNEVVNPAIVSSKPKKEPSCMKVLKELRLNYFNKLPNGDLVLPLSKASELWRESLEEMSELARDASQWRFSKENRAKYSEHAEVYYQLSIALFPEKEALTPYKLKLMLLPQICEDEKVFSPWDHITESLEKSNHKSQNDFHSKTMRAGGKTYNLDPMLLDIFFSYCKMMAPLLQSHPEVTLRERTATCHENVYKTRIENSPYSSYQAIMTQSIALPKLPVAGCPRSRDSLLLGMYFFPAGTYEKPLSQIHISKTLIPKFGGHVLDYNQALLLRNRSSKTPFCYVVLQTTELLDQVIQLNSQSGELSKHLIQVHNMMSSSFKFILADFFLDLDKQLVNETRFVDPEKYIIAPKRSPRAVRVTDTPYLLKLNRGEIYQSGISASSAVKNAARQSSEKTKRKRSGIDGKATRYKFVKRRLIDNEEKNEPSSSIDEENSVN